MSESIIDNDRCCFICGDTRDLDRHHVFRGESKRSLAEEDGCWVWLCKAHHTMSNEAVHQCTPFRRTLEKYGQYVWEHTYGDREQFRKRYGISYL